LVYPDSYRGFDFSFGSMFAVPCVAHFSYFNPAEQPIPENMIPLGRVEYRTAGTRVRRNRSPI